MPQVSRPILLALVAAIGFAGLWFSTLRPSAGDGTASPAPHGASAQASPTAPGVSGLARAVSKARGAVAASNAQSSTASDADAGASTPAKSTPAKSTAAAHATPVAPASARAGTPVDGPQTVNGGASSAAIARDPVSAALGRHQPVALLLINPTGSVDRVEVAEVNAAAARPGVLKLILPLEAARLMPEIARAITPAGSPTLVLIDRHGVATQLAWFVDRLEISSRLDAILATR